jgi:hypothetical protein
VKLKKVFLALGFAFSSLTILTPTPSKAEGGCPKGFFPRGGGYCRNIICLEPENIGDISIFDFDTKPYMKKYGLTCPFIHLVNGKVETTVNMGKWGNQMIPMR